MKKELHIILVDDVNKQDFINDHGLGINIEVSNVLDDLPNLIIMNVEESYIKTLRSDTRVFHIEEEQFQPVPASTLPSFFQTTKNITGTSPATNLNGSDYIPMQFYLSTDEIVSSQTVGTSNSDSLKTLSNANYFCRWTGKNVDIVSLEVGPVNASYAGLHNTHPDYKSIQNPGSSKIIPMNWSGLSSSDNNQISTNSLLSDHARGVLSVSAGTICGFAKNASLRVAYLNATDNPVSCINAIVSWHNTKAINPETGVKNPTLMISEYQYLLDRVTGIKVNDIQSITDLSGTINRPGSSWGSDLTPFKSRKMIPWRVLDPNTSTWNWCIVFPYQFRYSALQVALEQAWDAGITIVSAAGNNAGVYVKTSDPELLGVYCTAASGSTSYDMDLNNFTASITTSTLSSSTIYRPFYSYGPHGLDKGIDVGAGQNSEVFPVFDPYSNRGPGIDIVGLGVDTWSSYPSSNYLDGTWGMFSGTSCGAPTVAGICACMMERYYTYNNVWPTPDQIKKILLSETKQEIQNIDGTTWSNVSSASITLTFPSAFSPNNSFYGINQIYSGITRNGAFKIGELAGTTAKRVFLNSQSFDRSQTQSKRPISKKVYPRPKIKRTK